MENGGLRGHFHDTETIFGSQKKRRGQARRGNKGTDRQVNREAGGRGDKGHRQVWPMCPPEQTKKASRMCRLLKAFAHSRGVAPTRGTIICCTTRLYILSLNCFFIAWVGGAQGYSTGVVSSLTGVSSLAGSSFFAGVRVSAGTTVSTRLN